MVEIAGGQSLDRYFSDHITGPLGTGDEVWILVNRMRLIAENLDAEIVREKGMNYNFIMTRTNTDAAQAVDEFNAALESVRSMLVQQQAWLADENKRLEELRRA
jgi:hypothetical protein